MNVAEWIAILSKHDGSEAVLLFDSELGKTRELSSWDIEFKEQKDGNDNAVIELMREISQRVVKGEKSGEVICPNCGGTVQYVYENAMAMRAKCNKCELSIIA